MLVVIIPGELSARDETHQKKWTKSYISWKSSFVLYILQGSDPAQTNKSPAIEEVTEMNLFYLGQNRLTDK